MDHGGQSVHLTIFLFLFLDMILHFYYILLIIPFSFSAVLENVASFKRKQHDG